MAKLRPINETRLEHGKFSSETAARLLRKRGGLARARQQAEDGYAMLASMREKSILVRRLKAALRRDCHQCASFAETVLAALARLEHKPEPIPPADRKLLG